MKINELRGLMEKATPGPWDGKHTIYPVNGHAMDEVADWVYSEDDAALIVALVNAAPKLLAIVEAAKVCDTRAKEAHDGTGDWTVDADAMDALCVAIRALESE